MASRYDGFEKHGPGSRTYRTSIHPKVIKQERDVYIISRIGDRLDILAGQYYEDPSYWWIIATANNLGKGTLVVPPGKQIRIPHDPERVISDLQKINESRG